MNAPVYVAGLGIISAIGRDAAECLDSLLQGRAGMGEMNHLQSVHRNRLPVAEVKMGNAELAELARMPAGISRTALLGMIAAKQALVDSGFGELHSIRAGLISANTVGGMDKTEDFFPEFLTGPGRGRLRNIIHHECGSSTELIADQLGIRDHVSTISTACSSSANSIMLAARMIRQDRLDLVIAGGTDALTRFTLNGFNTLMILDGEFCKPFDEERRGLNLGEGAGYLMLVSERVAASLKKEVYCRLSGYANANDAYHQTASSPEGTGSYLAMKEALERSGLQTRDISYINLHGTGTQNNDIAEGTAIKMLFEPHFPPMSSTKSFTGHTLGASGGVEAVFSALAIRHGLVYPNLRLQEPIRGLPFAAQKTLLRDQPIRHVMSNSFGFGGNCSSLIFSKP